MSMLTIRNLDPGVTERLRVRAARNGRSMEAEAQDILGRALAEAETVPERSLYERVRARFAPLGGVELELPAREGSRAPPRFE
jgi:plasmid stability protein